jgi:hypothetical protein
MTDQQKTHDVRTTPGMSANRLADYMAASEQAKRSILRSCKYRPRARVIQHQEARESISDWLSSGGASEDPLHDRVEILRNGLQGTDFDNEVAEHNADFIDRFLLMKPELPSVAQEAMKPGKMPSLNINGFILSFTPDLILKRVNRRNVPKMGVAFFRYSKGKPLDAEVACWQGAISMGYLTVKLKQGLGDIDAERDLCVAVDMWGGHTHVAPTNAVYRFNEVRAVCAGIVERWEQIAPPENAFL